MRRLILTLCLFACLAPAAVRTAGSADVTTEILQEYKAQQEHEALLARHTLAAPLLTESLARGHAGTLQQSFFDTGFTMGSEGGVFYDRLTRRGIHVFFSGLREPSEFFWEFSDSFDLRDRWVRLRYAGEEVPERIALAFQDTRKGGELRYFEVYLDSSRFTQSAWVKLPAAEGFARVDKVRLRIEPGSTGIEKGDFWILDMEMSDPEEGPLAGVRTRLADRR